jgi:hypothetical protein
MLARLKPILLAPPGWVQRGATFDIDFTKRLSWARGGGTTLSSLLTNVNSTGGYVTNSAGLPSLVAANTLGIPDLGLSAWQSAQELSLWNRDLTNAAWTKTSVTAAKDQTGADGTATAASSLLATGANGTTFQTFTIASAVKTFSPYVKRITGSGTISITLDGGSTYTDITSLINSSTFTRVSAAQTLANPSIGFKISTSGDKIAVDFVGMKALAFVDPPIATTTVAVTRSADVVTGALGSWFNAAAGTFVIQFSTVIPNSANTSPGGFDDGSSNNQMLSYTSGTALIYFQRAGGVARYNTASGAAVVNGATNKVAMGYGPTPDFGAFNGANTQSLASAGLPTGLNRLILGGSASGGDTQLNGYIKRFTYFPQRPANAQVTALSV